jgi:hypothetical protein
VKFISLRAPSISKMDEDGLDANPEAVPASLMDEAVSEMVS